MHDLFLMSCCQLSCVSFGLVRGRRQKAIGELLKAQVECANSHSQMNIEESLPLLVSETC